MNNNRVSNERYNIGSLSKEPRPDMKLVEAVLTRRTVRRYANRLVPKSDIERLLRLSTHAPCACNRRGWRFILLRIQYP